MTYNYNFVELFFIQTDQFNHVSIYIFISTIVITFHHLKLTREEELEREVESFSGESECLPRKAQTKLAFELKEEGFRLKDILLVVGIPEATYHYHVKNFGKEDSDAELKELIIHLFKQFHERYGYKPITKELKKLGRHINHKKVYRIMRELGLKCVKFMRKSRKYSSYKGNVGKVTKNRLSRRFNTPIPLQK